MTAGTEESITVKSAIRHGMSWADQLDSPGWVAKSPPKFSEEMPDIVIDEQEYDAKSINRTTSSSTHAPISVYVGGLDYGIEARELEDFFMAKSIRVTRVRVQKNSEGKSAGRAYLNVYDKGALDAIIDLSGSVVRGRAISIREDMGPKPSKGGAPSDRKKASSGTKKTDKKTIQSETSREDEPKERKKLELKPRSKPIESNSASSSSRSSAIFGGAKARDEFAFEQTKAPEKEAKVAAPQIAQKPIPAPQPAPKKTLKNRFAIDSDSSSDDE